MMNSCSKPFQSVALTALMFLVVCVIPDIALAQATDPFQTGASNLQTALLTLATPVAVLLVMGLGVAAAAGRISWGWPLGILVGVGLLFAAPTVVDWLKGLFAA
jgi:type IV secretion system protein VirB2